MDRPLAPAWTIDEPLALRQRPGAHSLAITADGQGPLASLPVEWSGELLEIVADITVHETEWPGGIEVNFVPEARALDAPPPVWLGAHTLGTSRGGVEVTRLFMCALADRRIADVGAPSIGPRRADVSTRLTMRVSLIPALGEVVCELTASDGLHRLTLRGVRLTDAPPADPARARLASALVRGDAVAALAAFTDVGPLTAREQVWRALALLQVGRVDEARGLLTVLLAADPLEPALLHALRGQSGLLAPLLRAAAPERFLAASHALWRNTAVNHLGDPRARDALLAALGDLDAEALAAAREPAARAQASDLLAWRARAFLRAREPERARADFERAVALADGLAPTADRWLLWLDLASLAAESDDLARAREAIRRAYADSDAPLLVGDVIRVRPELAVLDDAARPR